MSDPCLHTRVTCPDCGVLLGSPAAPGGPLPVLAVGLTDDEYESFTAAMSDTPTTAVSPNDPIRDTEPDHHDGSVEVSPDYAVAQLWARNVRTTEILLGLIAELRPYERYHYVDTRVLGNAADRAEARLREVTGDE